jgi:MFS family permease
LLSLRAAASILSRMLLTIVLRRWSRDQLVTASLAGAATGLAALPFVLDVFWLAALSLIVSGFFLGLGQPVTMTLMAHAVRAESRSAALAIRILGNRAGQVLLPATAGLLAASLGASGAVWMSALLLGALVPTASRNSRAR